MLRKFRGMFSESNWLAEEPNVEAKVKALQDRYWGELASASEDIDKKFDEYVEHLRCSVEDCIKKYCVLNELFERKTIIKINGAMSTLSNKLVERFKELQLEGEKEERQQQRKRQEKRHEHR